MKAKYPEIELLLDDGAPHVEDRLFMLVSVLVGEDKWRYPLIWGGIYFHQLDLPKISASVAENILEHLMNLSIKKSTAYSVIEQLKPSTNSEKEQNLDQCLIALTFMFLTVDNLQYKEAISNIMQLFLRDITFAHRSSLDGLSSTHYYTLLEQRIEQHKHDFLEFKNMVKTLISHISFESKGALNTEYMEITIQGMLDEVKNKLEKPDRNLLSFNNYSLISDYAKSWLDTNTRNKIKRFPKHYFASDLRSQQLGTINTFWITASTGLYIFREVLGEL